MREAAQAGAGLLNDVRAFSREGAVAAAAACQLPVSLMHMSDEPDRMQEQTDYADVVNDVKAFLAHRIAACQEAGIATDQMMIDPGFGFGKTVAQNYEMLRRLEEFASFGLPVLVGVSRKSMIGAITGRPPLSVWFPVLYSLEWQPLGAPSFAYTTWPKRQMHWLFGRRLRGNCESKILWYRWHSRPCWRRAGNT